MLVRDLIWAILYVSVVLVDSNISFDEVLLIILSFFYQLLRARPPLKISLILYILVQNLIFSSQSHNSEKSVANICTN